MSYLSFILKNISSSDSVDEWYLLKAIHTVSLYILFAFLL